MDASVGEKTASYVVILHRLYESVFEAEIRFLLNSVSSVLVGGVAQSEKTIIYSN